MTTLGTCKFCPEPAAAIISMGRLGDVRVCHGHHEHLKHAGKTLAGAAASVAGSALRAQFPRAMELGQAVFHAVRAGLVAASEGHGPVPSHPSARGVHDGPGSGQGGGR